MLRRSHFSLKYACSRAFFHKQYKHICLPFEDLTSVASESQCYCEQTNKKLPQDAQLEHDIQLPNKLPAYERHVLVISPKNKSSADPEWKSVWQSKLELNHKWPYSIIGKLKEHLKHSKAGSGILVNAVSIVSGAIRAPEQSDTDVAHIFVLPDMRLYKISPNQVESFAHFIGGGLLNGAPTRQPKFDDFLKGADNAKIEQEMHLPEEPYIEPPFKYEEIPNSWLLICGHYQRDQRCGVVAQDLISEIQSKGLCQERNIALISHIGGHRYAGNMIFYNYVGSSKITQKSLVDCLWFGKIVPPNFPLLLKNLDTGLIPNELFRGGRSM